MALTLDASTLILIPCCASKASTVDGRLAPDPLAAAVPTSVYTQLIEARRTALAQLRNDPALLADQFVKNRSLREGPDLGGQETSGRYRPALERYTGTLYSVPGLRSAIYQRLEDPESPRLMILSALYGPLLPLSPIQDYNLRMDQVPARVWQRAFLPVLDSYVRTQGIRSIVLLVGSTTAYYRVASSAVSALLQRGALGQSTHYHVRDGRTRTTPFEHGIALRDLLDGRLPTSTRVEARDLGTDHPVTIKPVVNSLAVLASPPTTLPNRETQPHPAGMRRAPPPHANPAEVARVAALNARNPASSAPQIASSTVVPNLLSVQVLTATPVVAPSRPASVTRAPVLTDGGIDAYFSRFLDLMHRLASSSNQGLPLAALLERARLPERGVYFFLDPSTPDESTRWRICRIGTHAVNHGSKSTLRARLRAHLGTRSGSGNHRGSIFRLHVGNALLRRDGGSIATWGIGSVAPNALRESESLRVAEAEHERKVSDYIGRLPVLWLAVHDEASPASERSTIERNAIALLSTIARKTSGKEFEWLGGHSPRSEIRMSRLWNLNYVHDAYDPSFLTVLERAVARTLA